MATGDGCVNWGRHAGGIRTSCCDTVVLHGRGTRGPPSPTEISAVFVQSQNDAGAAPGIAIGPANATVTVPCIVIGPGGAWMHILFIYKFICFSNRMGALLLCYYFTALCTFKDDISASAICYL